MRYTRTGVDYRIKVTFEGDDRNRAVSTSWMYFRIVRGRDRAPTRMIPALG